MLVLDIKEGEILYIGDDIQIKVCRTSRGKVRLGTTAPRHIPIHRVPPAERRPGSDLPSGESPR